MPASFAGVPLSLGDPGGAVQAWVDRFRPLEDIIPVCTPAAYCEGRDRPQSQHAHAVGLPTFNWQRRPSRWRLNSLWFPTGASRFAIGLFMTTLHGATLIQEALEADAEDGSATLILNDGVRTLSLTMYALPMRPIGAIGTDNPVVLLPLVDRRYFWQFAKLGEMPLTQPITWSDVRTKITEDLGVTITAPDPTTEYLAPDWSEWARSYENAAIALDGYAATIGQRCVALLNGTYKLQKADDALAIVGSNLAAVKRIAGGECLTAPGLVPANVAVAFQRRQGGIPYQSGFCDLISKPATDYGFTLTGPGTAVVHTTFQADYSSRGSSADNNAAMNTLAGAIARDFYGWKQKQYSATARALAQDWNLTGFDDYLWFMLGTQVGTLDPCDCDSADEPEAFLPDEYEKPSPYLAQTLIESLPPNFGVEENLTQTKVPDSPRTFRPMPIFRGKLKENFSYGSGGNPDRATVRLLYGDENGQLTEDGFDVQVYDTLGIRGGTKSGDKVWMSALASDTAMFELVSAMGGGGADTVVFQLTSVLALGGFANARICTLSGSSYSADGDPIVVVDPYADPGCWSGLVGYRGIARRRTDGAYDVIFMERKALILEFQVFADRPPTQPFLVGQVNYQFQQGNKQPPLLVDIIDIHDPAFLFRYALQGGHGYAIYNDVLDRYEAIMCQQRCFLATAQVNDTGGFSSAGPITITGFTRASPQPFDMEPATLPTEAFNPFLHKGRDGDDLLLSWDEGSERWVIADVKKKSLDVITDVRIKADRSQLQVKQLSCAVEYKDDPADAAAWVDKIPLKTC